jgi:flagellar L-ring protein precursor FlgH
VRLTKLSTLAPLSLLSLTASAQVPTTVGPGSLFNDKSDRPVFARRTASRKGDILTIRVREVMKGQYAASTTTSKKEAATVNKVNIPLVDVFAGPVLGNILGSQAGIPQKIINGLLGGGNTGASQSTSGSGTTSTSGDFTATITVKVVDVDANGNLHIEGTRDVQVNKEMQKIVLTGVVRQDDVSTENTVPSEKIANVDIKADGKGAVADKTRRSLVGKILDWLF